MNYYKIKIATILLLITISNIFLPCNALGKSKKNIYVDARSAIAIDGRTGIILYEKNANEVIPMASTTKIMTTLVALNYGDLDEKYTISKRASSIRGSEVGYKINEQITLRELLYGLMLRSGNDAAIAIAEGVSGSVDEFVKLMNEYALQIGLTNTSFSSPHGLDGEKHYTTAYDLATLTALAKKNKVFNEIVSSKIVEGKGKNFSRSYNNINKLLYQVPEANGVKTGYTGKAGKCLVSSLNYNGNDIIIVTLNCTQRWKETKKIFDYVKENYIYEKILCKNEKVEEFNLKDSKNSIGLLVHEDLIIPKKEGSKYTLKYNKPNFKALQSISKGSYFGNVKVYKDDKLIITDILVIDKDIELNKGLLFKIKKILGL